jgi:sugar O-acyltransferase (sialic acid O-acetyltransferase NeuD family)
VNDVVILGAGGCARELYWIFLEANEEKPRWNVLGFVDDNPELQEAVICDLPVLGSVDWLQRKNPKAFQLICSAGDTRTRRYLAERGTAFGYRFCTVIHPSVCVSKWVELGPGTAIMPGCVLTTHVKLGAHTFVNSNSTIAHDTIIGPYCNINPGCRISGSVTFGDGVYFGTGAVIIQGKSVGEWTTIGAGAVVTSDIPAHVTAVGVPCRVIKQHQLEQSLSLQIESS